MQKILSAGAKRCIGQDREYAKTYKSARGKMNSRLTESAAPIIVKRKRARVPAKINRSRRVAAEPIKVLEYA